MGEFARFFPELGKILIMDTMMMEPWNLHETSCFGSPYASSFSTVHLALTLAGLEIATLSLITIHKEVIFGGGTPESVKRPRWSWIILTWPSVSFVEDQKLTIIRELSFVNIFSSHKCAPEVTQIVARTRWKRYHGLGLVSTVSPILGVECKDTKRLESLVNNNTTS